MDPYDDEFLAIIVAQARPGPAYTLATLIVEGAPERATWPALASLWRPDSERDELWRDLDRRLGR